MRCSQCGHTADQHDDAGACHVIILTGWKEHIQHFTGERQCSCTEYAGRYHDEDESGGCPHEVTPRSARCVHCGKERKSP